MPFGATRSTSSELMRPGRSSSPRVTSRQQTTRCLVSKQTRHPPLFPYRDVFTGHCRNLLPRWSSQQFQKIQRSSCRKRHGQLILVLDLGLRPNDHSRHRHGVGVPPPPVMSMSRCAHRERGASARGSFDFGRTDTTSCTERSNGDQENEQRFCAARPQFPRPGRCRAISSRAPPPTPHTSAISTSTYGDQGHPHYLGRDCESFGRS